jgi:pimeloyl-ACP methyl ester carboxylesterase
MVVERSGEQEARVGATSSGDQYARVGAASSGEQYARIGATGSGDRYARVGGASSGEQYAQVGNVKLCYETFGDRAMPALLLVMGLGSQMVLWEDGFCEQLAERGFWVIRFDNRDVGRSTILRDATVPTRGQLLLRDGRGAAYTLEDIADDAAGLLDHLEVEAAHVVGASMGGMVAQLLAIRHPHRVLSLVSIMSTTGNRRVGMTHPLLWRRLLRRPRRDREGYVREFMAVYRDIGSRHYRPGGDRVQALAELCFERGIHPAGTARQLAAIATAPDRTSPLNDIAVPTTVIHGDADRLVMPSGGRATAKAIAGARLVIIPGMAHDLPPELWGQVLDEIEGTAARAPRRPRR